MDWTTKHMFLPIAMERCLSLTRARHQKKQKPNFKKSLIQKCVHIPYLHTWTLNMIRTTVTNTTHFLYLTTLGNLSVHVHFTICQIQISIFSHFFSQHNSFLSYNKGYMYVCEASCTPQETSIIRAHYNVPHILLKQQHYCQINSSIIQIFVIKLHAQFFPHVHCF